MGKLVLYHAWASSASRKVRFCLAEKGLAYERHALDLRKFEHHTPEYRKLNPSGVVPALLHDGAPIIESTIINEYLDDVFPEPSLRPADARERAEMRLWSKYVDDVCLPAVLVQNWSRVMRPVAENWTDAELEAHLKNIPTQERRDIWRRMARQPYTAAELAASMDKLRDMIRRVEATLRTRPWLAGGSFSLADINMTPYVKRVEELESVQLDPERHPKIADWWRRITDRPGFKHARIGAFEAQMDEK